MLSMILLSLYWRYISKYWLWLEIFALALNIVGVFGLYVIPESPEYLYCFYRFQECREIMLNIAKWNSPEKI
jgi:hypothetical protein